jgi:hypothetical protein
VTGDSPNAGKSGELFVFDLGAAVTASYEAPTNKAASLRSGVLTYNYELKVVAFVKGQANSPFGGSFTFADFQLVLYQDKQDDQTASLPFFNQQ